VSIRSKRDFAALQARRVAQTPAAFANWPELLSGVARSRLGGGPETLTFRTRGGPAIAIPNAEGARVPVYEVFAEDCYDLGWFLGDLADRPIQALDIGAHVGSFSCRLGQVHPDASVDAYEPSVDTAEFLRRNVAANALSDRVTVHEAALAGETGWAMFERAGAASGCNHLASVDGSDEEGIRVETISFDDVVARSARPIELVKMDCEGGEYDLVYRSTPENWQTVQRLVLEYHPVAGQSWEELRAWFADVGLHVVRSSPGTPGLGVAWLSRTPLDDPDGPAPTGHLQLVGRAARRAVRTARQESTRRTPEVARRSRAAVTLPSR
jgi:FkbM family methyltransferase